MVSKAAQSLEKMKAKEWYFLVTYRIDEMIMNSNSKPLCQFSRSADNAVSASTLLHRQLLCTKTQSKCFSRDNWMKEM